MYNLIISTVSAKRLAPLGTGTFTGTMMPVHVSQAEKNKQKQITSS